MKLLGIGDNVMDCYLHQKKLYPGGNAVNVPVLGKRFGAEQAGYIGVMGNDTAGQHFLCSLKAEGLDVSRVRVVCGETAQNFINIDESGDRHFIGNSGTEVVEFMTTLLLNRGDYDFIRNYDVVHTSIHSWIDSLLPAIGRLTALSMDYSNDGFTKENIRNLAPLLSFAFFSGGQRSEGEVRELAEFAASCGARTVVVTMGERGSYILEGGKRHRQQAVPANILDALGAGDAFIGSFLTSYQDTQGDIVTAAQAASVFAAKCCEHNGAFEHAMNLQK